MPSFVGCGLGKKGGAVDLAARLSLLASQSVLELLLDDDEERFERVTEIDMVEEKGVELPEVEATGRLEAAAERGGVTTGTTAMEPEEDGVAASLPAAGLWRMMVAGLAEVVSEISLASPWRRLELEKSAGAGTLLSWISDPRPGHRWAKSTPHAADEVGTVAAEDGGALRRRRLPPEDRSSTASSCAKAGTSGARGMAGTGGALGADTQSPPSWRRLLCKTA